MAFLFCNNCGHRNPANSNFCSSCGAALDVVREEQTIAFHPADPLQDAAGKLIHPDALTWVVVGDVAAIEAPIRKLGLGEVKVLDTDGTVLR